MHYLLPFGIFETVFTLSHAIYLCHGARGGQRGVGGEITQNMWGVFEGLFRFAVIKLFIYGSFRAFDAIEFIINLSGNIIQPIASSQLTGDWRRLGIYWRGFGHLANNLDHPACARTASLGLLLPKDVGRDFLLSGLLLVDMNAELIDLENKASLAEENSWTRSETSELEPVSESVFACNSAYRANPGNMCAATIVRRSTINQRYKYKNQYECDH